jgi:hypothetical protein
MNKLASWSLRRVIVACVIWLLGAPVLAAIGLLLGGLALAALSSGQHLGFSVSLNNWSLAWLFLPPVILVVAWLASKKQAD